MSKDLEIALGAAESRANTAESMWRTQRERTQALQSALALLLAHVDAETCAHENLTKRGTLWTYCVDCDRKWSSDRNPYKPHKDHPAVAAARVVLAGAPNSHVRRYEALRDVQALEPGARWNMMQQAALDAGVGNVQTITGEQFDAFADALIDLLEKAK